MNVPPCRGPETLVSFHIVTTPSGHISPSRAAHFSRLSNCSGDKTYPVNYMFASYMESHGATGIVIT